jgi:hypothetical protein
MMMARNNDEIFSLRRLAMDRKQARENLRIGTSAAKERLRPSNLVEEAKTKAADQASKAGQIAIKEIKAHPVISATVAATATLIAMRRPIARLITNNKPSEPDQIEE